MSRNKKVVAPWVRCKRFQLGCESLSTCAAGVSGNLKIWVNLAERLRNWRDENPPHLKQFNSSTRKTVIEPDLSKTQIKTHTQELLTCYVLQLHVESKFFQGLRQGGKAWVFWLSTRDTAAGTGRTPESRSRSLPMHLENKSVFTKGILTVG